MKLHSERIEVWRLTSAERGEMYSLFSRYYDNTNRERFEGDLAGKDCVIRVFEPKHGRLCGFSTQVLLSVPSRGQNINAIFSGDTIVDPAYWNETALVREWGRMAVELIEEVRPEPLYWFLISKGYKTYRFLPVFFREFYPRFDQPTPVWAAEVRDVMARSLFPDAYDRQRGVVRASVSKDRLRLGVAEISPKRMEDPHVRFFVKQNLYHARGDELCCVAPLELGNFTSAAVRLLGGGRSRTANRREREYCFVP